MKLRDRNGAIDWYSVGLTAFFVVIAIFIVSPLIIVIVTSFNSAAFGSFPPEGFSLRWYRQLLERPEFLRGFINSFIIALVSSLIAVIVGLMAAIALIRFRFRGADVVRSFFLSPIVVPKIVLGLAFFILFVRIGIFGNRNSVILAHVVITFPFALAVLTGTLASLNSVLEEAAQDLGASQWQVIWYIIIPQTRVGMAVAGVFAFIISFDQIDMTIFLVRPRIYTLPVELFLYAERDQDLTLTAVSTLLIAFSAILLLIARPLIGGVTDIWSRR